MAKHHYSVVATALLLAFPLFSPPVSRAGDVGPEIVTRFNDGPIALSTTPTAMASIPLSGRNWFVTAKGYLVNTSDSLRTVGCNLGSGSQSSYIRLLVEPTGYRNHVMVPLTLPIHFPTDAGGSGGMVCATNSDSSGVTMNFVKLTAIEVGRLTNIEDGTRTSFGSGHPRLVSSFTSGPVALEGDDTRVARLNVGSGRWLVYAVGTLRNRTTGHFREVRCRLRSPEDTDGGTPFYLSLSDRAPLFHLLTTRLPEGGAIELLCRDESNSHDLRAVRIRLSALKLGRLIEFVYDNRQAQGQGQPRVDSAFYPGDVGINGSNSLELVHQLAVPAGPRTVYAKVILQQVNNPAVLDKHCRLQAGGDYDDAYTNEGYLMLNVSHDFAPGENATLSCASSGNNDDVLVSRMRISSISAGALSNEPSTSP